MHESMDIHGYSNNGRAGSRPRRPLVHVLASAHGDVQSICFHPDDAPAIAAAIIAAGRSAKRGRTVKKTIPLTLLKD